MCLTYEEMGELRQLLLLASYAKKERRKASACQGKQPFDSFEHAQRAIRPSAGGAIQPYKCRECDSWHLGGGHDHPKRVYDSKRRRHE